MYMYYNDYYQVLSCDTTCTCIIMIIIKYYHVIQRVHAL